MKISKKIRNSVFSRPIMNTRLIICTFILALVATSAVQSQNGTSFGIKGGLNYNANGDYFDAIADNVENPDRNIGYHIGVFGKFGNRIYLRPELVYTKTKSDYNSGEFDMKKIDAPILVGIKVFGPITVFGGPALQYILDTDFDDININDVENDFSVGLNFGIGLNFNKI